MRLLLRYRLLVLLQGSDVVEYPETTAMARNDQVVSMVGFLDQQIVHRRHRQIDLHRLPVSASVERNVETLLGSGKQQARAAGIDPHGLNVTVRRHSSRQLGPALAE